MLSVIDLIRRIDAGALTPAGMIDLCAQAIAAREGEVGAFAALDIGAARKAVSAAAALPLRGLPVGVKDNFDTADFPTEYNSPIFAGHRPRTDASLVTLVKRAGGVIVGKTVTTELTHFHPGRTRNPHNLAHTPGGSSSGSAAAITAGMLPLTIGTQTGGSIVRPASFCGIAGYKPSFRMLPTVGLKPYSWSLDTAGLFAASIGDVAYAAAIIADRDLRVDQGAPAPPSIALVRTHLWPQASAEMQRAVETAARAAQAAGARVKEVALPPILVDATDAQLVIQDYEGARALAYEYDNHRDKLSAELRAALDRGNAISTDDYDAARRTAKRARHAFNEIVETDVILTPSAPGAAPQGIESTGLPTFNRLWTLMGAPCVNVPGLRDSQGLPLGVQVVGRFGRDKNALEAAVFIEKVLAALA